MRLDGSTSLWPLWYVSLEPVLWVSGIHVISSDTEIPYVRRPTPRLVDLFRKERLFTSKTFPYRQWECTRQDPHGLLGKHCLLDVSSGPREDRGSYTVITETVVSLSPHLVKGFRKSLPDHRKVDHIVSWCPCLCLLKMYSKVS